MALPDDYRSTRDALHRVAAHVLGRRRHDLTGRFGLRVTPGGFGTPAFAPADRPDEEEALRVDGLLLVRERRDGERLVTSTLSLAGATLVEAATFAEVVLDPGFSVGKDTPPVGDASAPLAVGEAAVGTMARWLRWGAEALDRALAALGPGVDPTVAQLWPEHFDLGLDVDAGTTRANLGASVGDHYHEGPYVYVGPWSADRPGDAEFWNAAFGSLLGYEDVVGADDPVAVMTEYFLRGVALLAR